MKHDTHTHTHTTVPPNMKHHITHYRLTPSTENISTHMDSYGNTPQREVAEEQRKGHKRKKEVYNGKVKWRK